MIHPRNLLMQVVTNYAGKQRETRNNFPVAKNVIFQLTVWRWMQCSLLNRDGFPPAEAYIKLLIDTVFFGFWDNHLGAHQNKNCVGHSKISAWSVG